MLRHKNYYVIFSKELNATEDDEIAQQKIVEQLSKQPLFVVMVMSYNVNYRLKYKMKQILILDDRDIRHLHFKRSYRKALLTHVYTAKQCIEALNEFTFDAVYLDHDLRSEMEESGPIQDMRLLNG